MTGCHSFTHSDTFGSLCNPLKLKIQPVKHSPLAVIAVRSKAVNLLFIYTFVAAFIL